MAIFNLTNEEADILAVIIAAGIDTVSGCSLFNSVPITVDGIEMATSVLMELDGIVGNNVSAEITVVRGTSA